jgi:hypothetical protein
MKWRAALAAATIVASLVLGCALQSSDASEGTQTSAQEPKRPPTPAERRRAARNQVNPDEPHVAFDVVSRDHRRTTRYLLEITDANGVVMVHDLKKPRLRRGTIMVPLPDLTPGKYTFVVVSENPNGSLRSAPLAYEITKKK